LAEEITEPGACRVLARSAFGYGHEPDGGVAPGFVVVAGFALVTGGLLDVHAAASRATRASRSHVAGMRRNRLGPDMARLPGVSYLI